MRKKSGSIVRCSVVAFLVMAFTLACGQMSWGIEAGKYPKQLVFKAGAVGGPWIPMSTMIAELMMQKFPGLQILVQPGGGLANIRVIEKGVDSVIGFAHCPLYWEAKEGKLDKGNDYPKILAVLSATASTQQFAVRADSSIKSFNDLLGKKVAPGKKGSGGEITCHSIFCRQRGTGNGIEGSGLRFCESFGQRPPLGPPGR
jgi:TRAP-type uncharacterized transport system substrate-binding protein